MEKKELNESLSEHFSVISKCTIDSKLGTILLATFLESRYPYVYPRDCTFASGLFKQMVEKDLGPSEDAFKLLKGIARFIASVQDENGQWVQRYGLNGQSKAIYIQEDNTAYGSIILANYLLASHHRNEKPAELEEYLQKIKNAIQYALKNFYRQEIHLFFSTTALHESAIEKGYSIWVNHVYILLLNLLSLLNAKFDLKDFFYEEFSFRTNFCHSAHQHFVLQDRFVRRITPSGMFDLRPDVTMLGPVYFQCESERCDFCVIEKGADIINNSIDFMVKNLWDPELGMLQRYLPFTEDIETHIHAGNGPWIQYTAMLAQYHYNRGELERGDTILNLIDKYKSKEGYLPEHLSTRKRFEEFIRLEWEAGLDSRKEFHSDILIPDLSYDLIVDELFFMKKSYDKIKREISEDNNNVIHFAVPLMWSHVEYANALIARYECTKTLSNPSKQCEAEPARCY